jgi:hypothetical protein
MTVPGSVVWALLVGALAAGPTAGGHLPPGNAGYFPAPAERTLAAGRPLAGPVAIPSFSRMYRTSCATCHVTPGKLNTQGEAFRLNGYRFPDAEGLLRQDGPVALGAEPWKDLWPGSIWPGEIPGELPLALHLANDVRVARDSDGRTAASFLFPATFQLQAATALGGGVAAFAEVGWRWGGGLEVGEVKVKIHDPVPWLPPRALNLWIGAQRAHLLTFGDPTLDRAARQPFLWQFFRLADWELEDPRASSPLVSENTFRLAAVRPAVELNGLAAGRLHYGLGLAQGGAGGAGDPAARDVYVRLRQKLTGARLDGEPTSGAEPRAWGGQLLDEGVTLEQFAYLGEVAMGNGARDRHHSIGGAVRATRGRADLGIGHVRGRNSEPWGAAGPVARHASTFGRAEYLVFPWLVASLKADQMELRVSAPTSDHPGYAPFRRSRILPSAVVLLRQNVRAIAEGEAFLRDRPGARPEVGPPHALWIRLDLAY